LELAFFSIDVLTFWCRKLWVLLKMLCPNGLGKRESKVKAVRIFCERGG